MKVLTWLIGLPVAVVATVFAVVNRQDLHFDLWPFPYGVEAPAFVAVLVPLALGLVLGAVLGWVSAGRARRTARDQRRRADSLERQLEAAQKADTLHKS